MGQIIIIKELKKLARLTINLSDDLDRQMREFIKEYDLTITIFMHFAISEYLGKQKETKQLLNAILEQGTKRYEKANDLIKGDLKK